MKKNGIKNFILSFIFSLLAVVGVNEVVSYTPKSTSKVDKAVLPKVKNISLFSKQKENITENTAKQQYQQIENLVASKNNITNDALPVIDIEPSMPEIKTSEVTAEKKELKTENIDKINTPNHEEFILLSSASEIILEKEVPTEVITKKAQTTDINIVYADISDTIEDEAHLEQEQNTIVQNAQNIQLAQADTTSLDELIPIVENQDILHDDIDVLNSSNNSQIAMLEPSTLVSSIESFDKPEEKDISEIDLKQETVISSAWKHVPEEPQDSPWVVAKGNRFAKNKIAQIDILAEEAEEKAKEEVTENKQPSQDEVSKTSSENDETSNNTEKEATELKQNESVENKQLSEKEEALKTEENIITVHKENEQIINKKENLKTESILEAKPLLIPTDGKEIKVARNIMQNLFIPLPEDVVNDADALPQLSSEPKKKDNDKADNKEINLKPEEKESGLFKKISTWFADSDKEKADKESSANKDEKTAKKKKKKNKFSLFETKANPELDDEEERLSYQAIEIMPAELKLSFQPNRAEISGHTLRWIHAFADNARDNDGIYIEIRIDGTGSFALQEKRLNLLSSIFANRGVDFRKVNIIFTSREPNSFIIRNIRFNNREEKLDVNAKDTSYQRW